MNKSIEEILENEGKHWQTTVGDSMEPMLKDRQNIVEIVKPQGPLKRYDLPLYRRPDGKYVLHRILKVKDGYYVTCGDNRYHCEKVPKQWVIGVMSGYFKGEKYISADSKKYRFYVHLRCDFFFIRATLLFLKKMFNILTEKQ
jgi:hypothetical protein